CIGNQSITINGNMATAPGTLSYLWEGASSNVFNIATGSNSLKDYSILQGNPYTFFRRIVSSSLCMYSDTSNIVNLNQAPALLDIFPVDNTPGSCMVYYADGWVYIPSDIDS